MIFPSALVLVGMMSLLPPTLGVHCPSSTNGILTTPACPTATRVSGRPPACPDICIAQPPGGCPDPGTSTATVGCVGKCCPTATPTVTVRPTCHLCGSCPTPTTVTVTTC